MKTTSIRGVDRKPPRRVPKTRNARRNRNSHYLKRPELSFVDRLLRSFDQVAPTDWVPNHYQVLLKQRKNRKTLH